MRVCMDGYVMHVFHEGTGVTKLTYLNFVYFYTCLGYSYPISTPFIGFNALRALNTKKIDCEEKKSKALLSHLKFKK